MTTKAIIIFLSLTCLFVTSGHTQIREIKHAKFSKQKEIHKFDFLNASYVAGCEGSKVKVRHGRYVPRQDTGAFFSFDVSVSYGDLTGDKIEEALVLTECSGAAQNYDEGKIYTIKNHHLIKIAELRVGTKNGGSIFSAKIKNGNIIVKRGPGPDLCTDSTDAAAETAVFRLREGKLQQIGKSICEIIE